jgi:hypothetical protein
MTVFAPPPVLFPETTGGVTQLDLVYRDITQAECQGPRVAVSIWDKALAAQADLLRGAVIRTAAGLWAVRLVAGSPFTTATDGTTCLAIGATGLVSLEVAKAQAMAYLPRAMSSGLEVLGMPALVTATNTTAGGKDHVVTHFSVTITGALSRTKKSHPMRSTW